MDVCYRYEEAKGGGKVLVKDEPVATYISDALTRFASGQLQTQAEVGRYLEQFPDFPKTKKGKVHADLVNRILTQPLYAGYIEYPAWGITMRKGKHEPLISFEMYQRIQERLKEDSCDHAPVRENPNVDFPLRGFIECECGSPLTACWSKGRNKYYPYYICQNKQCDHYGKSLNRDKVEREFGELVKTLTPPKGLLNAAVKMLKELWDQRIISTQSLRENLQTERSKVEREINRLLDSVVNASDPTVISAFERKINQYQDEKLVMEEKIEQCGRPIKGFDEIYRTAVEFLAKPHTLWASEHYEHKRALLKMAFVGRLKYVRNEGYRTAQIALPFKVLGNKKGHSKSDLSYLVGPAGLEPATNGL